MFPRRDGIILGCTWDHDDWPLTPGTEQTTGILEAYAKIMKGLKGSNRGVVSYFEGFPCQVKTIHENTRREVVLFVQLRVISWIVLV